MFGILKQGVFFFILYFNFGTETGVATKQFQTRSSSPNPQPMKP